VSNTQDLSDELDFLKARLERVHRHGTVTDVDGTKHLIRMQIGGTASAPMKSPWIPYLQHAGARKSHSMPSVGQQMHMFSPDGDFDQAFAAPLIWSDADPSPSTDPNVDVTTRGTTTDTTTSSSRTIKVGGASIAVVDGSITLTVGGVTWKLSGDGEATQGGHVTHDAHDIGKTHLHTDVTPGPLLTGPPQ
jgi:phage baseplate assembly protein V